MCGIAGIYAANGFRDDPMPELRRTTAALEHRGPDDEGFHHQPGEPVALGHRRLLDEQEAGIHDHASSIWNLLLFSVWYGEFNG